MSDVLLQALERKARASGSPSDIAEHAKALRRAGREDEGRDVLLRLLQSVPNEVVVQDAWVTTFEMPWITFYRHSELPGRPNAMKVHNAEITLQDGQPRAKQNIEWLLNRIQDGDKTTFTQDELASYTTRKNEGKNVHVYGADAAELHRSLVAVNQLRDLNIQRNDVERAEKWFKQQLESWPIMLTRPKYGLGEVIHNYKRPDQYVRKQEIAGESGYVSQMLNGFVFVQAVLDADSIEQVDTLYQRILETQNPSYGWRPGTAYKGERAVAFSRGGG